MWKWFQGLGAMVQLLLGCIALTPFLVGGFAAVRHLVGPGSDARSSYATGVRQFEARRYEAARVSFGLALVSAPTFEDARFYRARALASLGRYDDALDDVRVLETEVPSSARSFVLGGYVYFVLRDFPRSEEQLGRALEIDPRNKLALFSRAQGFAYQHDYEAAAEDLEKVISLDPASRRARYLLAGAYSRAGSLDQALDNCHWLMRLDRTDPDFPELCGLIEHRAGHYEAAVTYYGIARGLDEDLPGIDENIGRAKAHRSPVGSPDLGEVG